MMSVQDLFDQAKEWSELANQLLSESGSLKSEADELWQEHQKKQSEIEELGNESDSLSREIGDLFERSQEAYHDGEHSEAKALSAEGHQKIEGRREARNSLFSLMRKCGELSDEIKSLRLQSKQKRNEAYQLIGMAKSLRQEASSIRHGDTIHVSYPHGSRGHSYEHMDLEIIDRTGNVKAKFHIPTPCQLDFDSRFTPGKYSSG